MPTSLPEAAMRHGGCLPLLLLRISSQPEPESSYTQLHAAPSVASTGLPGTSQPCCATCPRRVESRRTKALQALQGPAFRRAPSAPCIYSGPVGHHEMAQASWPRRPGTHGLAGSNHVTRTSSRSVRCRGAAARSNGSLAGAQQHGQPGRAGTGGCRPLRRGPASLLASSARRQARLTSRQALCQATDCTPFELPCPHRPAHVTATVAKLSTGAAEADPMLLRLIPSPAAAWKAPAMLPLLLLLLLPASSPAV